MIIDEDGAPDPPRLPAGTIIEKLPGGGPLYVVHLDKPVRYNRPYLTVPGGLIPRDWTLSDLSIQTRYVGHEIGDKLPGYERVIVNITNHSTGDFFAIGSVRRAG